MSSLEVSSLRRRGPADTVDRLAAAAADELDATGYAELTVRAVARRAGVSPATAYTWFASKDHLVAEAFLRLVTELPTPRVDGRLRADERIRRALAPLGDVLTARPRVAAAATVAMLSSDPDVAPIRGAVGDVLHHRLRAALGAGARPEVLRALDLALTGALQWAGVGAIAYGDVGPQVAEVAALIDPRRTR